MLKDHHHRIANYLRLAVTDRCNLRCRYCMPAEGIDFSDRKDLLSFEEIIRLSHIFRKLGVDKIRLTGGEPFVRRGIENLLEELSLIFPKVHITTNATLLQNHFELLKKIKIAGLNISIDSLNKDKFSIITRRDSYDIVLSNIIKCIEQGLPIKLNVVAMKGVNDVEIVDFVKFGIENNVEVRFIEAMPFNEDDGNKSVFLPASEIYEIIKGKFPSLKKIQSDKSSSSDVYFIEDKFKVGIIPAYTRSLCSSCNRIRMTSKGELLTCLYSKTGINLLKLLREEGLGDTEIEKEIINSVAHKLKSGYDEEEKRGEEIFKSMTSIGG